MIKRRTCLPLAAVAALALATAGCGGGGSGPATDGMDMMEPMPDPEPMPEPVDVGGDAANLAHVIDLASSYATRELRPDGTDQGISGWWYRYPPFAGKHDTLGRHHKYGEIPNVIVWHDENGRLQFNPSFSQSGRAPLLQETADFQVRAHRYIATSEDRQELLEGLTTSRFTITDHGLGPDWHVEELTNVYDGGGALQVVIATDLEMSDMATNMWTDGATPFDGDIQLIGVAPAPIDEGRDYTVVRLYDGGTIEGTLNGNPGQYSCSSPDNCFFFTNHVFGYQPSSEGIFFTPTGETAEELTPFERGPETTADYLSFGFWLYVPEDEAMTDDYDYGVFASGGDPFEATNLAGLTGTATYAGSAGGAFYVGKSSADPVNGTFSADVTLMADFGDGTATGTVSGAVSGFDWPEEVASSLPATVTLTSGFWDGWDEAYGHDYTADANGIVDGVSNIFDTPGYGALAPDRGGHILGITEAYVDGTRWWGDWSAAFFGNGTSATDHPTSIAGTFISSDNESGLSGGFGAHKQDDQQ